MFNTEYYLYVTFDPPLRTELTFIFRCSYTLEWSDLFVSWVDIERVHTSRYVNPSTPSDFYTKGYKNNTWKMRFLYINSSLTCLNYFLNRSTSRTNTISVGQTKTKEPHHFWYTIRIPIPSLTLLTFVFLIPVSSHRMSVTSRPWVHQRVVLLKDSPSSPSVNSGTTLRDHNPFPFIKTFRLH